MKSVADSLHREADDAVRALPAGERIALALRLGDRAVALYAAANAVGVEEARRILRSSGQAGRRSSKSAGGDTR